MVFPLCDHGKCVFRATPSHECSPPGANDCEVIGLCVRTASLEVFPLLKQIVLAAQPDSLPVCVCGGDSRHLLITYFWFPFVEHKIRIIASLADTFRTMQMCCLHFSCQTVKTSQRSRWFLNSRSMNEDRKPECILILVFNSICFMQAVMLKNATG